VGVLFDPTLLYSFILGSHQNGPYYLLYFRFGAKARAVLALAGGIQSCHSIGSDATQVFPGFVLRQPPKLGLALVLHSHWGRNAPH
jgi:hypothetical protein